ncbi:hypothetical protein H2198_004359 [Neophaeococcomyces mojaviensis]|uniref:Uncharacterized protein n=1 Tax=Neophaeococcomyces mojaviensis TaxID=3383035 RepID=A0ACC3A8Q0_9EURO|nr:hypothetical protein H2198_004359 [Knufia sp. JES_112]
MDLLATVRKEGSRGGQGDFKWTDVQASSRREHYLGHSLMAPVGRWAKGRDLNWYAKGDDQDNDGEDAVEKAARERKEEIKRIKEAEEEALARALGLPVAPRTNANLEPVSDKREVDKVLREATHDEDVAVKGIGYDSLTRQKEQNMSGERIEGNAEPQDKELQYALKEYERRHRDDVQRRHKSRSRSRERRHHKSERDSHYRRHRDRSRERPHRRRSRSRSPDRKRDRHHRDRSRSPRRSRKEDRRR